MDLLPPVGVRRLKTDLRPSDLFIKRKSIVKCVTIVKNYKKKNSKLISWYLKFE